MMKLGKLELHILDEGTIQVDGGAVFGPIPRLRWERRLSPDNQNRVVLGVRQLLVRGPGFNLLVDTGFGDKLNERTIHLYGIKVKNTLAQNLSAVGLKVEEITHVVFTHLHHDHSGGATTFSADRSEVHPTFPDAEYFVQDGEWQDACNPNDYNRSTYFFENFLPLSSEANLRLLKGDQEIIDGIKVQVTGGHTRFHQMVKIESEERKVFFPGDICPTPLHLPVTWHSASDLFPVDLLETKRRFLESVLNTNSLIVFSHHHDSGFLRVTGFPENPQAIEMTTG